LSNEQLNPDQAKNHKVAQAMAGGIRKITSQKTVILAKNM
jgi:hypothetical protein